jgi:glycosyltransferase involved in cell wall biosynthesis
VKRCYTLPQDYPYLNLKKISNEKIFDDESFSSDFDVFLVEGLNMMPMKKLMEVWNQIRHRAKTLLVIHEAYAPSDPIFKHFEFDAIICFDERYKKAFLDSLYPSSKIHVIPYPCHPLKKGNKLKARKELGLPPNKKIIFSYGLGVFRNIHLLPMMKRLSDKLPILFLLVTEIENWYQLFEILKSRYNFIDLRKSCLPTENIYKYLHASDLLLIHRDWKQGVVLSSTIRMCLGSLCPILVQDTNFVEDLNGEVIKYRTADLDQKLENLLAGRANIRDGLDKAERFVKRYSSEVIAKDFLNLFNQL